MPWQDIVLTAGSWIFIIALIPTLRGREKPQLSTSIVTGAILFVYAFVYATLGLWISVVSTSALAVAWLVLAVQRIRHKKQGIIKGSEIFARLPEETKAGIRKISKFSESDWKRFHKRMKAKERKRAKSLMQVHQNLR